MRIASFRPLYAPYWGEKGYSHAVVRLSRSGASAWLSDGRCVPTICLTFREL